MLEGPFPAMLQAAALETVPGEGVVLAVKSI